MSAKGRQSGFTLVEILIALTIGLFLLAGMIQMYVSNKQTSRFSEALSRMQENGRYALALIARDMRMADFRGCSRGQNIANRINTSSPHYDPGLHDFSVGLAGNDGASYTPDDPDAITLRGAVGNGLIVQQHADAGDPVAVPGNRTAVESEICGYSGCISNQVADMVLVSDCNGGDIFQATSLVTSGGNTDVGFNDTPPTNTPGNQASTILSKRYDRTAALHSLRVATYCINDGPDCDNTPGAIEERTLNLVENGVSQEVVEGVANMQIAYGEDMDDDGTADRYVPRTNVTDMDAVVSVRISLLLASAENNLVDQAQQISFNDQTFTDQDRRLYQVVTATFAIRNRSL